MRYRTLSVEDLDLLGQIDRSERITIRYMVAEGKLQARAVDEDVPTWDAHGDGERSVASQIAFARRHLERGARALGCIAPDGRLVGIGIMQPDIEPDVAQLAYLFVSRSFRRQGVAVTLLEKLTEWACDRGARELYVSSAHSASAVGFYQGAGFNITDHPNQELLALEPDDIHMRKRLSD